MVHALLISNPFMIVYVKYKERIFSQVAWEQVTGDPRGKLT